MDVLVADLDEAASAFGEQFPRRKQAVAQVAEVAMDTQLPRVAEGLDLLSFSSCVFVLAVLDVPAASRGLPVGAELDAVGRVDVDHLHLAAKVLPLRKGRHGLQGVAEDHPVRPVGLVLVEVDEVQLVEAIEGLEQRQLGLVRGCSSSAAQILDQHPRVDLLLDVDRRRIGHQIPIGDVVLAGPHQLRIQGRVAREPRLADGLQVLGPEVVDSLGRGQVGPLVAVDDGFDWHRTSRRLLTRRHGHHQGDGRSGCSPACRDRR